MLGRLADDHVAGLVAGEEAGGLDHGVGGEAGDLGDPFGRESGQALLQGLEAGGAALDEFPVVELLGDDDVHHPQGQGGVGARPERHPAVGLTGRLGVARIDDHGPHAGLLGLEEAVPGGWSALVRIAPPEDHHLRQAGLAIGDHGTAEGGVPDHAAGTIADGDGTEAVGTAEEVHEAGLGKVGRPASGAGAGGDCFGTVLLANLCQFFRDLVERLFPGDLFPLVGAARSLPLHGKFEAEGVVLVVGGQVRALAEGARRHRCFGVDMHLLHFAIRHLHFHGAALAGAEVAGGVLDFGGVAHICSSIFSRVGMPSSGLTFWWVTQSRSLSTVLPDSIASLAISTPALRSAALPMT